MSPASGRGNKGVSVPAGMSAPSVGGPLTRYPSNCMAERVFVAPCSHAQSVHTDVTRLGSNCCARQRRS
jgi:hypothetical protein